MARYAFIVGLFHSQLFTVLQRIPGTAEPKEDVAGRREVVVANGRAEGDAAVGEATAAKDQAEAANRTGRV